MDTSLQKQYDELIDILLAFDNRAQVIEYLGFNSYVKQHPLLNETLLDVLNSRTTQGQIAIAKSYWLHEILIDLLSHDWISDMFANPIMKFMLESYETPNRLPRWLREPEEIQAKQIMGAAYNLYNSEEGNHVLNIEKVIMCYRYVLNLYLPDEYPHEFATAQARLSIAYENRGRGDKANNLELAIEACAQAEVIMTKDNYRLSWAEMRLRLGGIYVARMRGNRYENIKQAIAYYEQALEVYIFDDYPLEWAMVQAGLGKAYSVLPHKNRVASIEKAIKLYKCALRVYTKDIHARKWAGTQLNIAIAYRNRLRGIPKYNIKSAIKAANLALQVCSSKIYSDLWAKVQNSLGVLFISNRRGAKKNKINEAIDAFKAALKIVSVYSDAEFVFGVSFNLAELLLRQERSYEAKYFYKNSLEALDRLRGESIREESRYMIAQKGVLIESSLVACCITLNDHQEAFEYASLMKSRLVTELIASDRESITHLLAGNDALALEWQKVQLLRDNLDLIRSSEMTDSVYKDLKHKEEELNQHINTLLFKFPSLASVQIPPYLTAANAKLLSNNLDQTYLIEYSVHRGGMGAFIVTPECINYVVLDRESVFQACIDCLSHVFADEFWENEEYYNYTLKKLYSLLIKPLEPFIKSAGSLVLAPVYTLHMLPFQAFLDECGNYLCEKYAMSFIPNLATLNVLYEQRLRITPEEQKAAKQRLLSIAYTGDNDELEYVIPEVAEVCRHFAITKKLWGTYALPSRIFEEIDQPFEAVHISAHGEFDYFHPFESCLFLAQNRRLTVNDIRLRIRLQGKPLVTLSACQTGQLDPERGGGANGLAWAFLAAGASAVISSQWSVADKSTYQLFRSFYSLRRIVGISNAQALQQAIQHVRHSDPECKFHPYYWAAFQVTGLPLPIEAS